jgi:hypothetical protein
VRVRTRSGRLHRIHRGVYAVGHAALTQRARFRAAVMACGEGAVLGIRVHRVRRLDVRDTTKRHGIRVTSAARTLLDLADSFTPRAVRRAVRQAQAEQLVNLKQIADVLTRANGRRGARELASIVAAGPAATRSEAEDIVLDFVIKSHLRHPDVNEELIIDSRRVYPDLRWRTRRHPTRADARAPARRGCIASRVLTDAATPCRPAPLDQVSKDRGESWPAGT